MSEGCPHFAIALHQLTGWPLSLLVDEANYEKWGNEEYPTIAHVFVTRPDGLAVDAKGPRTTDEIKRDFFDLEEPRIRRVGLTELRSMMGDNKPLYSCSLSELKDAKQLIQRKARFYGV
jgi:hypothetical protein